jgi:hypothetical protein
MEDSLHNDGTVYRFRRKWPGDGRPWSLGANRYKLFDCSQNNGSLVIDCTRRNGSVVRFVIPAGAGTHFALEVLRKLSFDRYNRCTFEINQETCQFTWRNKIHMDGQPYLIEA